MLAQWVALPVQKMDICYRTPVTPCSHPAHRRDSTKGDGNQSLSERQWMKREMVWRTREAGNRHYRELVACHRARFLACLSRLFTWQVRPFSVRNTAPNSWSSKTQEIFHPPAGNLKVTRAILQRLCREFAEIHPDHAPALP